MLIGRHAPQLEWTPASLKGSVVRNVRSGREGDAVLSLSLAGCEVVVGEGVGVILVHLH